MIGTKTVIGHVENWENVLKIEEEIPLERNDQVFTESKTKTTLLRYKNLKKESVICYLPDRRAIFSTTTSRNNFIRLYFFCVVPSLPFDTLHASSSCISYWILVIHTLFLLTYSCLDRSQQLRLT
ncbi:unnamed protein product [Caenorhabditis nigoni]